MRGEMSSCECLSCEGPGGRILASAVTRRQDLEAYVAVLYAAIRKHGCPEVLVSDSGSVFLDHKARQIYQALGIAKQVGYARFRDYLLDGERHLA